MAQSKINIPATGSGDPGPIPVAVKKASTGENVQQFELVTAVEGGAITPIASGNPLEVAIVGTVPISGAPTTVTANLGTLNGAATQTTLAALLAALGTPLQAGGSVVASGTVTANLGTLNGAATETTLAAVNSKLGGTIAVSGGGTPTDVSAGPTTLSSPGTVTISSLNGMSTLVVEVTASTTAGSSAVIQGTNNGGTTWESLPYQTITTSVPGGSAFAVDGAGVWVAKIAGYSSVRLNISTLPSGSVTAQIRASAGTFAWDHIAITGALSANQSVAVSQVGTTNTAVNNGTSSAGTQRVTIASDSTGQVVALPFVAGTATLTQVAGSGSTGTIIAANATRKASVIVNDSTAYLYVAFAATCSTSAYTYKIAPQSTLELPTAGRAIYQGLISGIWASATGNAVCTDLS